MKINIEDGNDLTDRLSALVFAGADDSLQAVAAWREEMMRIHRRFEDLRQVPEGPALLWQSLHRGNREAIWKATAFLSFLQYCLETAVRVVLVVRPFIMIGITPIAHRSLDGSQ